MATENQQPLTVSQSKTGNHIDNSVCNTRLKPQNINAPTQHPATLKSIVDPSKGAAKSNGKATGNTLPSSTLKTSATLSHPLSSIPNDTMHQNNSTSSAQPASNADACLDHMNLLSLKDPIKTSHASQNIQLTAQGNFSKSSAGELGALLLCRTHLYGAHVCISVDTFTYILESDLYDDQNVQFFLKLLQRC